MATRRHTLRFIKGLRRGAVRDRERKPEKQPPRVPARVTAPQALRVLERFPGGRGVIRRLERDGVRLAARAGADGVLTQFASFTARTKTGSARWIDFWNADLFDGTSHLDRLHTLDRIQFRTNRYPWEGNHRLLNRRVFGGVQAGFRMPSTSFFLAIVVVSSSGGSVAVEVDDTVVVPSGPVQGNGYAIPVPVEEVTQGPHSLTLVQAPIPDSGHLWFHSITCFYIQ